MKYHPLILFAEKNANKAASMHDLIKFLIILDVIRNKFMDVKLGISAFGGHDVQLVRSKNAN